MEEEGRAGAHHHEREEGEEGKEHKEGGEDDRDQESGHDELASDESGWRGRWRRDAGRKGC